MNGLIEAAVIKGRAPLLLGRPTLEKLNVKIDFARGTASLLDRPGEVALERNRAGQLLLNLVRFPDQASPTAEASSDAVASQEVFVSEAVTKPVCERKQPTKPPTKHPESPTVPKVGMEDSATSKIRQRTARNLLAQWRKHQTRAAERPESEVADRSGFLVAELFSPPRFKTEAERMGYRGLSFDIQQGWDLTKECTQREVDRMLDRAAPELLVVCIPCKHWGGWHRLNRVYLSPIERARLVHTAKVRGGSMPQAAKARREATV